MPRDASDFIVSAILCLLAILGYLGFTEEQKERLERVMSYHESEWRDLVELRNEKWRLHCQTYAFGFANELGAYYDPELPKNAYLACNSRYE